MIYIHYILCVQKYTTANLQIWKLNFLSLLLDIIHVAIEVSRTDCFVLVQ